jgi:hypothetical protein
MTLPNRIQLLMLAGASLFVLAACGGAAVASSSATAQPGASLNPSARSGASGQLVQINGQTLIVSNTNGDTNVSYTSSTTIQRTSTGTVADVVAGSCAVVTGTKDSAGAIAATSVRLSSKVTNACATPAGGPGRGTGAPAARPSPAVTPNPNLAFVSGQVTSVNGTQMVIQPASGAAQDVSVPTTVRVSVVQAGSATDLAVGECVAANGPKSSSGTVQASAITISPATGSGTCSPGGRGGFGGGGTAPGTAGG